MDAMRELRAAIERIDNKLDETGQMKAGHKRRTRRATISQSEQETLMGGFPLSSIATGSVSPDDGRINDKLSRIDVVSLPSATTMPLAAVPLRVRLGGIAGGVITVAICSIIIKLEL